MKVAGTHSTLVSKSIRLPVVCLCVCVTLFVSCATQKSGQLVGDPPVLEGVIHIVSRGETLIRISQAYGLTPQRLQRINNIHDPNALQVGQRLFIPGARERKTATLVQAAAPRQKGVYHIVKPGETLWRIAETYNVSQRTIERQNRIHDARKLSVGKRLFIPGADKERRVEMTVAEKVYHGTSGSREKRIALGERIQRIVDRYRVEKGDPPRQETKPQTVSRPPPERRVTPPTPTTTPKPAPAIAFSDVRPPSQVKKVGTITFSWPLPERFALLKKFGVGTGLMRNGVILSAGPGTSVVAAADGEVQLVGDVNDDFGDNFGNYIILYHGKRGGKGLRTIYAHNSEVLVKAGDKVRRGQVIARVGRTGRSPRNVTGDHLHFEIREAADPLNPLNLLPPIK